MLVKMASRSFSPLSNWLIHVHIPVSYTHLDVYKRQIFICMEGSCKMRDNEGNELTVSAGESILLPATTQDVTITPEGGNVKLLETYV